MNVRPHGLPMQKPAGEFTEIEPLVVVLLAELPPLPDNVDVTPNCQDVCPPLTVVVAVAQARWVTVFFLPTNEDEPDEPSASVNAPTDVKVESASRHPTTIKVIRLRMVASIHV